jgi:hypothetical protein
MNLLLTFIFGLLFSSHLHTLLLSFKLGSVIGTAEHGLMALTCLCGLIMLLKTNINADPGLQGRIGANQNTNHMFVLHDRSDRTINHEQRANQVKTDAPKSTPLEGVPTGGAPGSTQRNQNESQPKWKHPSSQ